VAQDGPQTFNAFSVASAHGTVVPSGEQQSLLVAVVKGPLFIETDEGPVEAGSVSCAASLRLNGQTRQQSGSGACSFIGTDGATAWGEWQCEGYDLVGCRGKLALTGGSGRFKGISGGGGLVWRPSSRDLAAKIDGTSEVTVNGILLLRDFTLALK
jgi:hypothetical protein